MFSQRINDLKKRSRNSFFYSTSFIKSYLIFIMPYYRRNRFVKGAGRQRYSICRKQNRLIVYGPHQADGFNNNNRNFVTQSYTTIIENQSETTTYVPPIYKVKHLKFNLAFPAPYNINDIFMVRFVVFYITQNVQFQHSSGIAVVNSQGQQIYRPNYCLEGTYAAHPEWILIDKTVNVHDHSSSAVSAYSKLSKNLNSGDKIIACVYVYWKETMQIQQQIPGLDVLLSWSYATRSN